MIFENSNDISSRLSGTLIRYKGRPFYCHYNGSGREIILLDPETVSSGGKDGETVNVSNESLDFSSPPLGFCDTPRRRGLGTFYLMRQPWRRWKQGIDPASLIYINVLNNQNESVRFNYGNVAKTIAGDYKSYDESVSLLERGQDSAFDRRLALASYNKTPLLCYRNTVAGFYNPQKNSVWLHPNYKAPSIMSRISKWMTIENG